MVVTHRIVGSVAEVQEACSRFLNLVSMKPLHPHHQGVSQEPIFWAPIGVSQSFIRGVLIDPYILNNWPIRSTKLLSNDFKTKEVTGFSLCRGLFGEQCSAARVREEMAGYSDFALHCFALQHPKRFGEYALDAARVMDSGKCVALAQLLPRLKVRPLLFSFATCSVFKASSERMYSG